MKKIKAVHPGEILNEEFLKPMSISQYKLAKDINVTAMRVSEIVRGKRSISANTALRLSKYFGNSAEFWLNIQSIYDLAVEDSKINEEIKLKVKVLKKSEAGKGF